VIHTISNQIRRGKTLGLTWMTAIQAYKGRKIYSNYHTVFTDVRVTSINDLDSMRTGWFAADDIYMWLDSRRKQVGGINKIMSLSGKRGIDICWTTTRTVDVDARLRANTEVIWYPVMTDKYCYMLGYEYIFRTGASTDAEVTGKPIKTYRFESAKVFPFYDTYEEIQDINI